MKCFALIFALFVVNVPCEGNESDLNQFVSVVLKKLDEIRKSDAENARSLQKQLSEFMEKQENIGASVTELRSLFEDVKRQETRNAQLLITLSQDIDQLKSKGAYAEKKLQKTVTTLRLILQSSAVNLGDLLVAAVKDGDSHRVLLLLDLGAPIEHPNPRNNRPIHVAVEEGHPQILELLLERKADIEGQGEYQKTALHLSTYHRRLECTRILVDQGANPNAVDEWGNTPLFHPAILGLNEYLEVLLKNGARVDVAQEEGYTPLHFACKHGNYETVELLVRHGADFRKRADNGDTPLSFAKANGHWKIASFLENKL